MLAQQKQSIADLFSSALKPLVAGTDLQPSITLERPRDPSHGDIACNIAMQLAKPLKKNPRELAQAIVDAVLADPARDGLVESAEIAGPGFINLRVAAAARQAVVKAIFEQGADFGKSRAGEGRKVLVEFVSANPTGPLHVGHGRQGALGDALSSLLEAQGYDVLREFYYNDAGVQIATLATSVQARARGVKPGDAGWPESAYNGDYIADIARDFLDQKTVSASDGEPVTASGDVEDIESIRRFAVAYLRHEQDLDLQAFGVKFDNYYLESSLYADGKVAAAVEALVKAGKTYEQDGALWLRTTDYGDDKDRVMKKTDGTYTYFVPDVAYHINKWQRGYGKVINVQGSDHHGTIARVRAGLQAAGVGIPQGYPDYVLHKMVTVMRNGEEVKISKRAGSYVTLRDLIEWSAGEAIEGEARDLTRGRDAVRFFLISRKADTEFVFDVDLALAQSDENPVYYVQYAHARICTVLGKWGGDEEELKAVADLSPLTAPREAALLAKLAEYPEMLAHALAELGPHQVAFYLRDLAGELHSYYNAERVLVDDVPTRLARLALMAATRQVLRNGLALLGVSAPARM
ncbi:MULTISPECIES: arginine--tRNA ligase [unclassified Herbaspirillum]|uniref:arginine--tRNA ligase n=1 Tax=unclassified Herbaspirillum TaxID=2624150 RepID=UPI001153B899|nr:MULTISPECIES: arginine--tRNA ligase [unclassified Herbaspirillum]MBB5390141.1 arginyl-tRNA synthetase [Herbaspirillum sp. SJZ102]TQK09360.1 arginyl-tRNA synthetase [Herbaspirillum sp. SJZ130]TQK13953.1 arginyl-tRNA synthetase [Herbaspirillum sp. SJZ106]TWC69678.1 arginyl-tRNA synthetase [Herbaspirillum sp. SJZ099]